MKKRNILVLAILVLLIIVIHDDQSFEPQDIGELRKEVYSSIEVPPPYVFTTDGCSLWPNSIWGEDLTDICIEHDIEYWRGGSAEERKQADDLLRERVNKRAPFVGDIMYLGVRAFGGLFMPTSWRWGYGFNYPGFSY
ncbi:MAG: hypothetical protein OQJ98_01925 [Candidatus Pacebacteria bacterium]|nr:hypothetical protein [Candidatus Paceibacterota bacterium]